MASDPAFRTPYTDAELEERFRYHRPTPEAGRRHEIVMESCLALAKTLRDIVPMSAELAEAIGTLTVVRMQANAGIALHHDLLVEEKSNG